MALKYTALNSITGLFPSSNITDQGGSLPITAAADNKVFGKPGFPVEEVGLVAATKYLCIPLESMKYKGSVQNKWLLTSSGNRAGGLNSPLGVPALKPNGDPTDPASDGAAAIQTGAIQADFVTDLENAGGTDGGFRALMRGMHESAYAYTTDSLTGSNAYTYWGESQGSYQVYNPTTLSRRYTTDLYYSLGPDQAGKDAV